MCKVDVSDNNIIELNNMDLYLRNYRETILKYNIENGKISQYVVLKTQKNLSNEFIFYYILNEKYSVL